MPKGVGPLHDMETFVGLEAYSHLFLTFTIEENVVSFTSGTTSPPGQS